MALDETGGTEAVEQPQRVEAPPPPPSDRPGTPGSPSRAESRAAAQDNGQARAEKPTEQPSTSPPDSSDGEGNGAKDGYEQSEASSTLDQGGPAEQQDTDTAGGLDSNAGEAPDSPADAQSEPGDQSNERTGDESASDQILGGNADGGVTTEASDATGELGVEKDQAGNSVDAKRPSDGVPTVTEEQSTDVRRESSDQSAAETESKRANNDTAQDSRPEANAPDQPLHRQAQETEQSTNESPDTKPDLPKPDTGSPGPTETPENQTPTSDQLGDPQTPADQTETTANQPDGLLEPSSGDDTDRSTYKMPYQFVAESYPVPLAELEQNIEKLRDQRNREDPDSSGKDDDPTKPPTGEELLKPEVEGLSRRERLLREAYEDIDDVFDVAEKASSGAEHMLNLEPPTGHAEIVSGPEYHPAPHEGLNAGEITTGLLALGIVAGEGIRRVQRVLQWNRKA